MTIFHESIFRTVLIVHSPYEFMETNDTAFSVMYFSLKLSVARKN